MSNYIISGYDYSMDFHTEFLYKDKTSKVVILDRIIKLKISEIKEVEISNIEKESSSAN